MKRIAIINEDGTLEINGQLCKVVPVEPTEEMLKRASELYGDWLVEMKARYEELLAAATLDLSGLPGVPEKETNLHLEAQILRGYQEGWNAALDAIGVGK